MFRMAGTTPSQQLEKWHIFSHMKHKTIHEFHFLYKIWKHLVHDTEHAKESFYDISYLFLMLHLFFGPLLQIIRAKPKTKGLRSCNEL